MNINYLNFKTMKTSKLFIAAIFCLSLITSCSSDDDNSSGNPDLIDPVELITNVTLTFTNTADANDVIVMTDIKPNGQEGGIVLQNDVVGTFTAGEEYALGLEVLNASNPADIDDVLNDDIVVENDEHFFQYALSTGLDMSMTRDADDIDGADGTKLGYNTTWVANTASTGNLQIILVHIPATADDTDPFGATTGGEEDFTITFDGVTIVE